HLQGLVQRWVQIPRLSCHGEVSMGRVDAGQGSYGEPRDGEVATAPARGVRAAVRALWVEACSYDRRALVICLYVPVALTLLEYMFRPSRARSWMPLTPYLTWAVMPFLWYFRAVCSLWWLCQWCCCGRWACGRGPWESACVARLAQRPCMGFCISWRSRRWCGPRRSRRSW